MKEDISLHICRRVFKYVSRWGPGPPAASSGLLPTSRLLDAFNTRFLVLSGALHPLSWLCFKLPGATIHVPALHAAGKILGLRERCKTRLLALRSTFLPWLCFKLPGAQLQVPGRILAPRSTFLGLFQLSAQINVPGLFPGRVASGSTLLGNPGAWPSSSEIPPGVYETLPRLPCSGHAWRSSSCPDPAVDHAVVQSMILGGPGVALFSMDPAAELRQSLQLWRY